MSSLSGEQQLQALRQQLLEAYVQREQAEERIKAIRNVIAGIPIGQAIARETPPAAPEGDHGQGCGGGNIP